MKTVQDQCSVSDSETLMANIKTPNQINPATNSTQPPSSNSNQSNKSSHELINNTIPTKNRQIPNSNPLKELNKNEKSCTEILEKNAYKNQPHNHQQQQSKHHSNKCESSNDGFCNQKTDYYEKESAQPLTRRVNNTNEIKNIQKNMQMRI